MKTTYLVWKDPNCGGVNVEWQEITGQEFLALVRSLEKGARHFIKLWSCSEDSGDGAIVMEATIEQYREWKKGKRHREYLRDSNPGYQIVSYHAMETADGCFGEELLRDIDCDVEAECFERFEREAISSALAQLSDEERHLIEYMYFSKEPGTVRGYEKLTDISKSAASRRQIAALAKLKNFLSE
jgi:hypothetical protein